MAEGIDMYRPCYRWDDYSIGQFVLYEKDYAWMDVWLLNPEWLGALWLMTSATWGELFWLKASEIWKASRVSFELFPEFCLTTEQKHGKPLSE
jgi:hypothetical protein